MSLFGKGRSSNKKPAPPPPPTPPLAALPPPTRQPIGFETVLGIETQLEGRLKCDANIRLDGAFTGTLEITGNVLVGETGNIKADINARNISIAGTVRGNITGSKVQLLRTARVWGDIQAAALTTEEGAFIDGKIAMNDPKTKQSDATGEEIASGVDDETPTLVLDAAGDQAEDDVTTLVFDAEQEKTPDEDTTLVFETDEDTKDEDKQFDESETIVFRADVAESENVNSEEDETSDAAQDEQNHD